MLRFLKWFFYSVIALIVVAAVGPKQAPMALIGLIGFGFCFYLIFKDDIKKR